MNKIEIPHSPDAEKALLGAIMGQGYLDLAILIPPSDFYLESNRKIYLTIIRLADAGDSVDLVTVVEALRRTGELERVGGVAYVTSFTDAVPIGVATSVQSWGKEIRETAIRRRLMHAANDLLNLAPRENFEALELKIQGLREMLDGRVVEAPEGSLEAIENEYRAYVQNLEAHSLRTGIQQLDERTGGFQFGELLTLIARTAVGKSAIAQNIIGSVLSAQPEASVVFASLEMPRLQAFERQVQIFAGMKRDEVIAAYRSSAGSARVEAFVEHFKERFHILDRPGLTLAEIERKVSALVGLKRLVRPVRLLTIDYLAYLGGGAKNIGLVERTSELARGAKQLAKRLDCVVLLIAQTSRRAGDGSEEVTITDARDSGAIEDSADFLIGCWRPELKTGISPQDYMDVEGELWFRILKARRGLQDKFCVRFEGETLRVQGW